MVSLLTVHGLVNATFDVHVRNEIEEGVSNKLTMALIAITGEVRLLCSFFTRLSACAKDG